MALNKFMHPRNIYKNPPDFVVLAKFHEEFCSIVKQDINGKVTIDFKDPHSLRVLTKCLLKTDFNLNVIIPEDRLVPTLPLRLNYILWIEDLLSSIHRKHNIRGLDIGTGACAIYPLLAAVKNKWVMFGTETDEQSLLNAQENVQRNDLQDFVKLIKNPTAAVFKHLLDREGTETFDFTMCNPPFYSNLQELCESRSPARLPPKNGFTGSPQELITEGGELAFCRKMIEESKSYKSKVIIFSTMVGHKYHLKELELDLKAEGIRYTTTEFCQGRVTRWGLAWTYQDYDIFQLVPARDKSRKKNTPITYLLPELPGSVYDIDTVSKRIKSILQDLKVEYKILNKSGNNLSLDIVAMSNTWSNQRRKRRFMKHLEVNEGKKRKLCTAEDKDNEMVKNASTILIGDKDSISFSHDTKNQEDGLHEIKVHNTKENNLQKPEKNIECNGADTVDCSLKIDGIRNFESNVNDTFQESNNNRFSDEISTKQPMDTTSCSKDNHRISEGSETNTSVLDEPILHSFLKIIKKENGILLEMDFLNGTAGKEGIHQVVQYIKNNWK